MKAIFSKTCLPALAALLIFAIPTQAQFTPVSDGVNWQRTVRVMNVIEPFDLFNEFMNTDADVETPSRENVHYSSITSNFWEVLRDSVNEAIKADDINIYSLRPSEIRGQENIYVKNERIEGATLSQYLSARFDEVVASRFSGAAAQSAPFYFSNFQNGIARVSQRPPNFDDLIDINMFQLELIFYHDETGFGIKPTKLIFVPALFNSAADFDENRPVEIFPYQFAFMIDLTEEESVNILNEKGIQYSGEQNIMSFYDLISLFHFDYFYYSVSNQDLFSATQRFDGRYELDELRSSTMNYFNELIFNFTYGQVPSWWIDGGKGSLTSGIFETSEGYVDAEGNGRFQE